MTHRSAFSKSISVCSSLLLSVLLLTGCTKPHYRNDVSSEAVAESILSSFPLEMGYRRYPSDVVDAYFPNANTLSSDTVIAYSLAPDDYTEIGVFHAGKEQEVEDLIRIVEDYLNSFREAYLPQARQYSPTEEQKLKDAAYLVYDRYVIYLIMTENKQSVCRSIIREALLKEETK